MVVGGGRVKLNKILLTFNPGMMLRFISSQGKSMIVMFVPLVKKTLNDNTHAFCFVSSRSASPLNI